VEKKIRFATAILDFSKRKGGAERYLVDLCTRMVDNGFEVHVYAEHWDEENPRIHYHRIKTIPFPKSLQLFSFAMRATKEMKQGNYDITMGVGNTLEADVLQPHGGVHWAWFWRSLRVYDNPIFWTMKFLGRIFSPKQWISGWIEDAPYRSKNLRKIIAISDMVKQDILRWYGISEDRIDVIYNGVDIERFHPRNRQYREEIRKRYGIGDEFVILFVSNNFRMKGLGYLIKELAKIKKEDHPPFKLLILGRDRQSPYLHLAKKIGVFEEVIFAGSTNEPEKYYGAADLLVHPTFYDACSLTVLEALASGLSVITTSSNGASGVLNQGEEGLVIQEPIDVDQLSMAIKHYFAVDIRHHSIYCRRDRREVYSEIVNFEKLIVIFKDLIKD
jgi:UDP-glucose:(heptosyl)LPS alpha-1,3-glucosyltransferase